MPNSQCKSIAAAAAVLTMVASGELRAEWDFMLEPYIQATSIDGSSDIGRLEGVDVGVNFDDILEDLEEAFLFRFEALHSSGWGAAVDYGVMDLSSESRSERGVVLEASTRQAVTDLSLFRRFDYDGTLADVSIGLRHWDNKLRLRLDLPQAGRLTQTRTPDWLDGYVGVRVTQPISSQWSAQGYLDIGGGDSSFASTVKAGLLYGVDRTWGLELAYRATWVDYATGRRGSPDRFAYDTVTHGPVVGLTIRF